MTDEVEWVKSSRSKTTACVEVGWAKSSRSATVANCVEVAGCHCNGVMVRDTKDKGAGPVLMFERRAWAEFVDGVKAGEFDPVAV